MPGQLELLNNDNVTGDTPLGLSSPIAGVPHAKVTTDHGRSEPYIHTCEGHSIYYGMSALATRVNITTFTM